MKCIFWFKIAIIGSTDYLECEKNHDPNIRIAGVAYFEQKQVNLSTGNLPSTAVFPNLIWFAAPLLSIKDIWRHSWLVN